MDVEAYLRRIGYPGGPEPVLGTLRGLHRAHLLAVPFENLDIGRGTPIVLDETRLFDKIVRRRRGGFCYELNGLFAALLRALGYTVTLLSARVHQGEGFGPEFDHLTLLVSGGQLPGPYLADVGFGECFREPLPLVDGAERLDGPRAYRLRRVEDAWHLDERQAGGAWRPAYRFTLQPRQWQDFEAMCQYHQTSPESHFTRGRIYSLATPEGRLSLSEKKLVVTRGEARDERALETEAEWWAALREVFGVEMNSVHG
jgi:N-hydroxyarylamine O-acetyltransferase